MQREIRPFRPEDAANVAQLWNESDSAWPGGFTHGVPFTPEIIRLWQERERDIEVYIAFADGKAVGYCSLTEFWEDSRVAYVQLLGAHPGYHGQGFGRDLLRTSLRRTVELGYDRLDLHTWAGNLKAVPLYKKTGFFWLPGTAVHMHNYLPTIFKLEAARRFFRFGEPDEVDWYSAFRRDLSVRPDEWEERGMRVFPYEFAAAGRRLRVLIDPEARAVTSVETDRFAVSAWRGSPIAPRGVPAQVGIEVQNLRPELGPVSATLLVRGGPEIQADLYRTMSVHRQESVEVAATPGEAATVALSQDATLAVRTTAVLDGEVIEVVTGLRVTAPIEVSAPGGCVVLRPQAETPVALLLRSSLAIPVRVALQLTGSPELAVTPDHHVVEIPAEGSAGVRVTITARRVGGHELGAAVAVQEAGFAALPAPQSVAVHAVGPGDAAWTVGEREAYLTSSDLVVKANRRGGSLEVADTRTGTRVGYCYARLGPPFGSTTLDSTDFDVRLEESGQGRTIVLSARPSFLPGVVFERRAELQPGGVLRLSNRLTNGGTETLRPSVEVGLHMGHDDARFAAPLASGLVVDEAMAFPDWVDTHFLKPEVFAEPWVALETDGLAIGLVWESPTELGLPWESRHFAATFSFGEVAPGASVDSSNLWLFVGSGDWRAVRRFWRAQLAPGATATSPTPRRAMDLRLESPLLTGGTARLVLSSDRSRQMTGKIEIAAPEGVAVEPSEIPVEGLSVGSPVEAGVRVKWLAPGAGAVEVVARAELGWIERAFHLALVRAGDPDLEVRVAESTRDGQRVVTVDNGFLSLAVGPDHGGSLFELRDRLASHLSSSFPTPEPQVFLNPWFGGVTPQIWLSSGFDESRPMAAYSYRWTPARRELLGQEWSGIRLSAEVDREHNRGLDVEVEYLTLGGSNLVALVARLDTHGAPFHGMPGFLCFPAPEGATKGTIAHFRRNGLHTRRQVGGLETRVEGWCALESESTGRCLVAFTPDAGTSLSIEHGEDYLRLFVQGIPASALDADAAGRPVEAVVYLALARSREEALAYRLLGGSEG